MNTSKEIFKYDYEISPTVIELCETVRRDHVIRHYNDETRKKTQELLDKSRGQVIFIDEAYTLPTDNSNMFDSEYFRKLNEYLEQGIVDRRRSKFCDWSIFLRVEPQNITLTPTDEDSSTHDDSLNTYGLFD